MLLGPLQVKHVGSQLSQVLVEVLGYFPAGQLVLHVVPSKYFVPMQLWQSDDVGPVQVEHVGSQLSQVLVEVLGYFPAGQVVRH